MSHNFCAYCMCHLVTVSSGGKRTNLFCNMVDFCGSNPPMFRSRLLKGQPWCSSSQNQSARNQGKHCS
eukprot:6472167-Amphidinium_carterae.1